VEGGFMGRTNKLVDGCYSFWLGGLFPLLRSLPPAALAAPAPPAAAALAAAAAARGAPAVPRLPELAVVGPAAQAQAAAERAQVRACAGPLHAGVWAG
jgi:putative copper export protein